MTLLDRYILRSLCLNYAISLAVMMTFYIVLHLFFNMDEFTESEAAAWEVLSGLVSYYGTNLFLYFAQLSGVITLFAGMLTLARMRRLNELTAMLASGVSLYRVAAPVLAFGILTSALWYVDSEWIIPDVSHILARRPDQATRQAPFGAWFLEDLSGRLLSAQNVQPESQSLEHLLVLERDAEGRMTGAIEADRAVWEPQAGHPHGGWWNLENGIRRQPAGMVPNGLSEMELMMQRQWNRLETDLTPEAIQARRGERWTRYLSSAQLAQLVSTGHAQADELQQVRHARFATPWVNLLLLVLGIPVILKRIPGNLLTDSAVCMVLAGLCFVVAFVGQNVVRSETFPALPAWLPLIVFAPVGAVLFDRMKT